MLEAVARSTQDLHLTFFAFFISKHLFGAISALNLHKIDKKKDDIFVKYVFTTRYVCSIIII